MKYYDEEGVRELLRKDCPAGTRGPLSAFAEKIGCDPRYLGEIANGAKAPNQAVLNYYKLKRQVVYFPTEEMPEPRPIYGDTVRKLRELDVGSTCSVPRTQRNGVYAQAKRLGIRIKTSRDGEQYTVERIA